MAWGLDANGQLAWTTDPGQTVTIGPDGLPSAGGPTGGTGGPATGGSGGGTTTPSFNENITYGGGENNTTTSTSSTSSTALSLTPQIISQIPGFTINSQGVAIGPDGQPASMQQIQSAFTAYVQTPDGAALLQNSQFYAQLPSTIANIQQQIQASQAQVALNQQTLNFNVQKQQFQDSLGLVDEARQTQQQVYAQQQGLATLQMQQQQMITQVQQAQAALTVQAQTAQAQAQIQQAAQLQSLASTAGTLTADPGDRAALAAFALSNSGFGKVNTAIGRGGPGANLITNASLTPLESDLRTQQSLLNNPPNITAPNIPLPNFSNVTLPQTYGQNVGLGTLPPAPNYTLPPGSPSGFNPANPNTTWMLGNGGSGGAIAPGTSQGGGLAATLSGEGANPTNAAGWGTTLNNQAQPQGAGGTQIGAAPSGQGINTPGIPSWAIGALAGNAPAPSNATTGTQGTQGANIPAAKSGGFLYGAYISGEAGPELNIPLGDGKSTRILNQQQAKKLGMDLKAMAKMPQYKRGGIATYADGGIFSSGPGGNIFSSGFGNVNDNNRDLSLNFLNQAYPAALSGTPWQQTGQLPAPVYASSPGFDPNVAQLIAGLQNTQSGYPASSWLSQAQMLAPAGVNAQPVGRAA